MQRLLIILLLGLVACVGAKPATIGRVGSALSTTASAKLCFAPADACTQDSDCAPVSGNARYCTRTWNKDLELVWKTRAPGFGHCLDPNGKVAANAAIQADLCSLAEPRDFSLGTPYKLPPDSLLLFGDIGVTDEEGTRPVGLTIFQRVLFDGNGATIDVPTYAPGGTTHWQYVAVNIVTSLAGNGYAGSGHAAWSSFSNVTFRPTVTTNKNLTMGLLVRSHGIRVSNVHANNIGTCIRVDGQHSTVSYNANATRFQNLLLQKCYTRAMKIGGYDTNGGYFQGVENNDGAGIDESSFATSTWIAEVNEAVSVPTNDPDPAINGKVVPAFAASGTGHTVVGMHYESTGAASDAHLTSTGTVLWVGGNGPANAPDAAERVGFGRSRLIFGAGADAAGKIIPDGTVGYNKIIIPGTVAQNWGIFFQDRSGEPSGWYLRDQNGYWGIFSEGGESPFRWKNGAYTLTNPTTGAQTAPDRGKFLFGKGFQEVGNILCCDGLDNDMNGKIDCAESTCAHVGCAAGGPHASCP